MRALSLPQCHGHPDCGREPQLFHDDAFTCVALPPGTQDNHQSNAAGRLRSIWGTVFGAHCERGVPSDDAAVHGIVERPRRSDIDVVETKARFALIAGPRIAESGLRRAKPRRLLAPYRVRDLTHSRMCVGSELDANHVCGMQQARHTHAGHCARCVHRGGGGWWRSDRRCLGLTTLVLMSARWWGKDGGCLQARPDGDDFMRCLGRLALLSQRVFGILA